MEHLKNFENNNFFETSTQFFKELNIPVNIIEDQPFLTKDFLKTTYNPNSPSQSLIDKIYLLGLVDDTVLNGEEGKNTFAKIAEISSDYEGIVLVAVQLKNRENGLLPTRSQLAEITRAINREFQYMPVTVLFKYDNLIALANAERTSYLVKYKEGEKVGKVSLLRDISIVKPHSGHLQILNELKVPKSVETFKALDKHWSDVFSVSLLNKRFYKELSNWYFWAIKEVKFPNEPNQLDASDKGKQLAEMINEHKATNVIRLLTRLLFVWFLKEKKLIPEELFDKDFLDNELLKDLNIEHTGLFQNNQKSTYYKAILQNLFFASLNCPIKPSEKDDKKERRVRGFKTNLKARGADYEMRYEKDFKNPKLFLELVNKCVPFLNGGLFECLDVREDALFIDGFSDNMSGGKVLIVPDYLFFGLDETIDLSAEYGIKDKQTKQSAVKGLIRLLKSYKFTIDENTPVEEDVALDPELLGKVFENLLASYNPETKTTARKQTGSFYTPREIVNYMVDESLKEYLKTKMLDGGLGYIPFGTGQTEMFGNEDRKGQLKLETELNPYTNDEEGLSAKLNTLFSYTEEQPFKDDEEVKKLISAIDACKILDPACGSGAFPMGILQKMVHVLQKLDPENRHWKDFQKHKALIEMDEALETLKDEERAERIADIEKSFDESTNNPDYARKLFLIENCVYGVDIQPIATQISRLRFFISLVVDQKPSIELENFGIRPLPNLEAKFVTANTLIGIEKNNTANLFDKLEVAELEAKLKEVRHRLFSAKSSRTKRNLKERDKELRSEIAGHLSDDIGNENAQLLANWDPYDQNVSAPFFDPEWMFGLSKKNGGLPSSKSSFFDVVLGNPPYIKEYTDKSAFDGVRNSSYYQGKMDLWYLFACNGIDLLANNGLLCFIATNNWTTSSGASKMRNKIIKDAKIVSLLDFGNLMIFESASIQTMVMLFQKNNIDDNYKVDFRRLSGKTELSDAQNLILKNEKENSQYFSPIINRESFENKFLTFNDDCNESILRKISSVNHFKLDNKDVSQGIVIPQDFLNKKNNEKLGNRYSVNTPIFVLTNEKLNELELSDEEQEIIKPYFESENFENYFSSDKNELWIIYTNSEFKNAKRMKAYPNLKKHLDNFSKIITSDNKPYGLHRAREEKIFLGEKIIVKRKCVERPEFSYCNFDSYVSATFNIIKTSKANHKYLTGVLNSKLIAFWLKNKGKMQGNNYQLDKEPLMNIPIYLPTQEESKKIEELVDEIIILRSNGIDSSKVEQQIDELVFQYYDLDANEITAIN